MAKFYDGIYTKLLSWANHWTLQKHTNVHGSTRHEGLIINCKQNIGLLMTTKEKNHCASYKNTRILWNSVQIFFNNHIILPSKWTGSIRLNQIYANEKKNFFKETERRALWQCCKFIDRTCKWGQFYGTRKFWTAAILLSLCS